MKNGRQLDNPMWNRGMMSMKDAVGGTCAIVDYSDSGSSTEDEDEGMIGTLVGGRVALVEQEVRNVKDRQLDHIVDLSGTQIMRDVVSGGTGLDLSGLSLENVIDIKVEEQNNGGKVHVMKEEREEDVLSTYMGDDDYWRNGRSAVEEKVELDQDVVVEVVEPMLDNKNHPDCTQHPVVQSFVEEWEDGVVLRTLPGALPTLVEFSFSTGDSSNEGEKESVVEQETGAKE